MQQRAKNKLNLLTLRRQYTHPHELYDTLRAQDYCHFDPGSQSWLVTGHTAATTILDDPRFRAGLTMIPDSTTTELSTIHRQMLFMDGEKHHQAQNVMLRPLAQMVKQIAVDIQKFAQDALTYQHKTGEMDIVSDFASPVSLMTIAHVLGMSTEDRDELQQLERWSDTFGDVTSGYIRGDMHDIQHLEDYFRRLIAQKRRTPSNDLLSAFIQAQHIFPTEDDLVANCMMVFAAGRITTKKLLGNGVSLLLPHWDEYRHIQQENTQFLKSLAEELLRMITPTRYLIREAGTDVDLSTIVAGEHLIQRGQRVLLFLEAADYDPAIFTSPGQFDPQRRPNKHISFGYGPHQCPGATLARVEIHMALQALFSLSGVQAKPDVCPVWNSNPNLGGFASNPLIFTANS